MAEATTYTHGIGEPSPWVMRWAPLLRAGAVVLDVASGWGRHARYLAARGCVVDAVDRDAQALHSMRGVAGIHTIAADIEGGPWPCHQRTFDAVVVTNYLHRPIFPLLLTALAPNGVLIYETFALGNEQYGRPSNPVFLLQPGELLERVRGHLKVIAYEDLLIEVPKPAMVQRICAVKE